MYMQLFLAYLSCERVRLSVGDERDQINMVMLTDLVAQGFMQLVLKSTTAVT